MKTYTRQDVETLAKLHGYEFAALQAIIDVESGGHGFSEDGKIIIQFEPSWFKRKSPYTPSGAWTLNKVERQSQEWLAFNDAFQKDPTAAMLSTSIGLMQVMGFNFDITGFDTVNQFWDYCKESEANQIEAALRFIKSIPKLAAGLKRLDWKTVAFYYNGAAYRKFNYDTRLGAAYLKHK